AAEKGEPLAQANLGVCYLQGLGVQQNLDEALKLLKPAAEKGNEIAQTNLGAYYLMIKNYDEGIKLLKPMAEKGNILAQANLGTCYMNGWGVQQNFDEALKLLKPAAERGDQTALTNLGVCYMNGWGVQQNFDEALKLLKPLSDIGNARALTVTAFCHVQKINEAIKDMGTFAMKFKDSPDANSDETTKALKEKIFTIDAHLKDAKTWYKNIEQQGFKLPTDVQTKFNGFITEMEKLLKELDINELKK
ncbi:MAG: tetratricopeptide repeat protein, partial [Paludibacteraceae bacterium]|nr:tetratricopeptide repeat protein [Paludibacteraceae bacterium]